MPTRLNLTVIRCSDIEASAIFYGLLGIPLEKHRHGSGPEHYASTAAGWTFELYPATSKFPPALGTRVGFAVESCDKVIDNLLAGGHTVDTMPADSPWGRRAVVTDPDGHKVELVSEQDNC